MVSSYGLTHKDIEEFTGITFRDFMINGQAMTLPQWESFVTEYIEVIAQIVHRYCNVPTFDPGQPEALVTEYRNGKGPTDDWDYPNQYLPQDYQFYLKYVYYPGGTVNGTIIPPISVFEDMGGKTAPPEWLIHQPRTAGAQAEVDAILVTNGPTVNGTVIVTLNNMKIVNVSVTAGQTIAQVCAAIVAAGPQTDGSGYVWTPTTDGIQYVWWTCNIAAAVNLVQVNVQGTGTVCNAYQQAVGSAGSGGDYEVVSRGELTCVSFYNNIPAKSENNVKLVYYTGFDPSSKPYQDIKFEIKRVFKNLILVKKNIQAVLMVTANGARDYQGLTNQYNEGQILSHMEESTLKRYKRLTMAGGSMFE